MSFNRKHIAVAFSLVVLLVWASAPAAAQRHKMDLRQVISMAKDSSLTSFRYKHMYRASYWQWRSFRSERLPSLTLGVTPVTYNRYLTQRYDSDRNMDVYREQQSLLSSASLTLSQNFAPLGGTFYLRTSAERLRNFGSAEYTQFSTVPIKIGYTNSLLGYNEFRWSSLIEPVKFEKAKLLYLHNTEYLSSAALEYFFSLAQAQTSYDLAVRQLARCDTLYAIGQRRVEIAAISRTDLMSLRLDVVNARSSLTQASVAVQRAMSDLASFLGMRPDAQIDVVLPGMLGEIDVDPSLALEMMRANSYALLEQRQAVLEAEQAYDKVRKQTRFQASLSASVGFNQQAESFGDAWRDPLRQDLVSVSVSIPLLDWGVGRGRRNMAKSQMEVARVEAEQTMAEKEQAVLTTISELSARRELLEASEEALALADAVYQQTTAQFLAGSADLSRLSLTQSNLISAQRGYIESMRNYWSCLYELRRMTLYDFVLGISLADAFDFDTLVR